MNRESCHFDIIIYFDLESAKPFKFKTFKYIQTIKKVAKT